MAVQWSWRFGFVCFVLFTWMTVATACTCKKTHPQEHYCSADFVVLVQVQRADYDKVELTAAYKVRIRKEFKVTDKAREALSHGRILTPTSSSTCGVRLEPGKRYLLSGRLFHGKPWIYLCHYQHEWDAMSVVQKKGFKRLYTRGCDCKVVECHWWSSCPADTPQTCQWTTAWDDQNCQEKYAICMKSADGSCRWSQSKSYRICMKRRNKTQNRTANKGATSPNNVLTRLLAT